MINPSSKYLTKNRIDILKNKNFWITVVKILAAAGLIYIILTKIELEKVLIAIEKADVKFIIFAFILTFVNLFLQYLKWKLTCNSLLNVKDKKKIFFSLFYGITAGSFTPARVGEYFGRAVEFKDKPLLQVTVATFVDKLFLLFMVLFWGSVASILFLQFHYGVTSYITVSLFAVVILFFYLLYILMSNPAAWNNILFEKLKNSKRIGKWLSNFRVLKNLDKSFSGKMITVAFFAHLCFITQFALLVVAFSHSFNFFYYIWAGNLVMFSKTIIPPVTLGELGIREGVSVFFLSKMGVPAVSAFNASIFLFMINILFPAILGLLLLLKRNNA